MPRYYIVRDENMSILAIFQVFDSAYMCFKTLTTAERNESYLEIISVTTNANGIGGVERLLYSHSKATGAITQHFVTEYSSVNG